MTRLAIPMLCAGILAGIMGVATLHAQEASTLPAQELASAHTGHEAVPALLAPPMAIISDEAMDKPAAFPNLTAKWQRIDAQISNDAKRLEMCRNDATACTGSEAALIAMIDQVRGKEGRARLGLINRAVNLAIRPESDIRRFGARDVWSAPLDTLTDAAGDCEDYAILKMLALQQAGVDPAELRLVIVRDTATQGGHAVLAARLDGRWVVLDNRGFMLVDFEDTRYALLAAFRTGPADQPIGLAHAPHDDRSAPGFM